jgi:hypothetical protein
MAHVGGECDQSQLGLGQARAGDSTLSDMAVALITAVLLKEALAVGGIAGLGLRESGEGEACQQKQWYLHGGSPM